jgi:hypothetical protein
MCMLHTSPIPLRPGNLDTASRFGRVDEGAIEKTFEEAPRGVDLNLLSQAFHR